MASNKNHNTFKSSRAVTLPMASVAPAGGGFSSNLGNTLNQATATSLGLIDNQINMQNNLANRAIQYQLYNKTLGDVLGATQLSANPGQISPTNFGIPTGGSGGGGGTFA